MSDLTGEGFNRYTAPSDAELAALSEALRQKIEEAAAVNRMLYGDLDGDEAGWSFYIESTGVAPDESGYIPFGELQVTNIDDSYDPEARTLEVSFSKHLSVDPKEVMSEVYEVTFEKNTQKILGVNRAAIEKHEKLELDRIYSYEFRNVVIDYYEDKVQQAPPPHFDFNLEAVGHSLLAGIRYRNRLDEILSDKFLYGAGNSGEVVLLTQTLQSCHFSTPSLPIL